MKSLGPQMNADQRKWGKGKNLTAKGTKGFWNFSICVHSRSFSDDCFPP